MTSTDSRDLDTALAALNADIDALGTCGLVYELLESRANDVALRHAAHLAHENRQRFLDQAAARGLYMPDGPNGWLLVPADGLCAHGLDPDCCPCGCGDIEHD